MSVALPLLMDSPDHCQPSNHYRPDRVNSFARHPPVSARGAVQKRSSTTANSHNVSANPLQRLSERRDQAASFNHVAESKAQAIPATAGFHWITPQHSPQPDTVFEEPSALVSFPRWTAPTPPHSDSGIPSLSLDNRDAIVNTAGFNFSNNFAFAQSAAPADMSSSLSFLLGSQYGSNMDGDDYHMDHGYQIPPVRISQSTAASTNTPYAQAGPSSPSRYQGRVNPNDTASRRRPDLPPAAISPHVGDAQSTFTASANAEYTAAAPGGPSSSIGVVPAPLPSPNVNAPGFTAQSRTPPMYDSGAYSHSQTVFSHHANQNRSFAPSGPGDILARAAAGDAAARVMNQRPKPQCWDHGCNGRQFSTFSNLLRHQREKSGTAAKSYCPKCGAEFTRTTARNGHLAHDKCTKVPQRESEER